MPQQQAQSDPWVEAAKNFKAQPQGETAAAGNDDWKVWQQNDTPEEQPSMMQQAGSMAKDFGAGILKGAGSTANNIGHMFYPDWLAKRLTGAPSPEQQEGYFAPKNMAETLGKGAEQVGEFMLPGGAEEKGAAKIAEMAPQLGKALPRIATSALSSGAVNAAQGGSPLTGAALGAGGQVIGQGLKAMAPAIAEGALNIRKLDRAYGKSGGAIGRSILDETRGIRPGTVAESAEERLGELNPKLEQMADRFSYAPISSMTPARTVVNDAAGKAAQQGERTTLNQLDPLATHLEKDIAGNQIPANVTPRDLLNLKRGFGNEFIHRWNPETMTGVKGTAGRAYHAMAQEFNQSVPGAEELNSRISNLIPVAKRAESAELNAPTMQRAVNRFAAHTGALTGAGIGGTLGYREGGLPGAVAGGVTGVLAPELIASPEGEMATARLLNKTAGLKPLVGAAAQFGRRNP